MIQGTTTVRVSQDARLTGCYKLCTPCCLVGSGRKRTSSVAGGFRTLILREGKTIICAATVRVFGTLFAECVCPSSTADTAPAFMVAVQES